MTILNAQMLSPQVLELLAPIPGSSPTGIEEPINVKSYASLSLEIEKALPNFPECALLAAEVLRKHSKHLRVAAWLTLAWLKTNDFIGLKDGLNLLAALLECYPGACFPTTPPRQIKAIAFVQNTRVIGLLKGVPMTPAKAGSLQQAREALLTLTKVCAAQFPQSPISFHDLSVELERLAALKIGEPAPLGDRQPAEATVAVAPDQLAPEAASAEPAPTVQASPDANRPGAVSLAADSGTPGSAAANPEAIELKISSEVLDLLEPLSQDVPAGRTNTDENNYFNLSLEITNIRFNVERCIEWAKEVLKNSSKDLNVILWLGFAWYRKEALQGLYDGFMLLGLALQKYGTQLNPPANEMRLKAFNFWNQKQLAELIRRGKIDAENNPLYLQLERAFAMVAAEMETLLPEAKRFVAAVQRSIAEKATEARELLKPAEKPQEEEKETPSADENSTVKVEKPAAVKSTPAPVAPAKLAAAKDAMAMIKEAILFHYQEQVDGKTRLRLLYDPAIFALSRALYWTSFRTPVADGKLTNITAPLAAKQAFLSKNFAAREWAIIAADIEARFISGDTSEQFRYWLDGQRYVVLALEALGAKEAEAAMVIKKYLAQLLELAPDLPKYSFADGSTPLASVETRQWLDEYVLPLAGGGGSGSATVILPPIFGEEYDVINQEYESARKALPGSFEENAQAMQKAIEGDQRRKGRFLRQLNLANYCHAAKQYSLAKALLGELMQKIEQYQLAEWEPALCLAVWQTAYLTNQAVLKSQTGTANADLEKQQGHLYEKIGALDIQRALKLVTN